jgi:hypothetical protein
MLINAPDTVPSDISYKQITVWAANHAHWPADISFFSRYTVAVANSCNANDGIWVQSFEKLK